MSAINRREALQAGLAILSAAGVDGEVATLSPVNPQALVLTVPKILSQAAMENLRLEFRRVFKGTSLEGVRVLVLMEGLSLQVIDDQREVRA